jgi:hypothetical protein
LKWKVKDRVDFEKRGCLKVVMERSDSEMWESDKVKKRKKEK